MARKEEDDYGDESTARPWFRNKFVLGGVAGVLGICLIGGIGMKLASDGRDPVTIDPNAQSQGEAAEGGSGIKAEEYVAASEQWAGFADYPGSFLGVENADNEFGVKAWEAGRAEYDKMEAAFNPDGTKEKPQPVGLTTTYGPVDVTVTTASVDGNSTTIYFDMRLWDAGEYPDDFELIHDDGSTVLLSAIEGVDITENEKDANTVYSFRFTVEGKPVTTMRVLGAAVDEGKGYHDLVHYYSDKKLKGGPDWNEWVAKHYEKLLSEAGISPEAAKELPKASDTAWTESDQVTE